MLPTENVVVPQICRLLDRVPFRQGTQIHSQALLLDYGAVTGKAVAEGVSWRDWLCDQLVVGLWAERYRRPVLAFYLPSSPIRVSLCTLSEGATFQYVYRHLHKVVGVGESGSDYLHPQARPVVLWRPPGTMVRLWPPPDRDLEIGQSYVVDAGNLAGFYSYPYDDEDVDMFAADRERYGDYAIVPSDEHAVYLHGGRDYPCVNRFYRLKLDRNADDGSAEDGFSDVEDIARAAMEAWLRDQGRGT